jgi:hypothetical protein
LIRWGRAVVITARASEAMPGDAGCLLPGEAEAPKGTLELAQGLRRHRGHTSVDLTSDFSASRAADV